MKSTKKETMRSLPLRYYIQLKSLPLGYYIQLTQSVKLRGLAHEMHTGKPKRHFHWDTSHN